MFKKSYMSKVVCHLGIEPIYNINFNGMLREQDYKNRSTLKSRFCAKVGGAGYIIRFSNSDNISGNNGRTYHYNAHGGSFSNGRGTIARTLFVIYEKMVLDVHK